MEHISHHFLITVFNGGDYYVTVTNSDTCSATSSLQSVTVNEAFATIQFTGTTNFCEGDSVMLSSSTAVLYNWSNGNTSQNIYASESDNYYVTITDVNGCTDMSNSVPVSVYPFADIEFSLDSARACNELKVKFINTTIAEPNSIYNWSFGDGQSSASVSPVHAFDSIGVYTVVLTVTTPNNCISADSMEIILQGVPEPISKFTTEPGAGALFGTPIKFVNESQYANQYHWDFGDHTGSKEENPVHGYKDPGVYKIVLEAANDGGCKDFYEMQFSVAPFFIPSTFTPNNDGKNETFPDLNYGLNVNYFAMEIWNRWGMRIFASNNPYDTFRGKDVNGNDVPFGIYQYRFNIITGSGKPFKMEGSINLLR